MKVLHLSPGRLFGGLETLLLTLARHSGLVPEMRPHFAACFEGLLGERLADAGFPVHRLGAVRFGRPWTLRPARQRLEQLLRDTSYDVAVCHECWSHALFAPVLRRCRVPMVFWGHDCHQGRHWLEWWSALTPPDLVIGSSRWAAQGLTRLFPQVPTCLLSPPVPNVRMNDRLAVRREVRAALGTMQDAAVVVMVARLERLKGHAVLLRALGELKTLPDWECWIAGGAQRPHEISYREELGELANQAGIADRVRFLGQRSDVPRLLAAADVFCQPNTGPESFGIAFVEALHAGLPVVTTAIGGAREIVDDTCGILVPPDDPLQVAAALERLLINPGERRRLGQGGQIRGRALCDPATQMDRIATALSGVSRRTGQTPLGAGAAA